MTDYPHYTNYEQISEAIIDFGNLARSHGLNIGTQETLEAIAAAEKGMIDDLHIFRYAMKAIYCTSEEELVIFNKIFDWFWGDEKLAVKGKTTLKNQSNLLKSTQGSLVMLGKGKQEEEGDEAKRVSGANAIHRLRKTDFSKIEEIDSRYLEEIAMKLWGQMSLRLKRKMKRSRIKKSIDLRQTIRASIGQGGEPFYLQFKSKKKRKQRLVVLLDVSGSMDKYSFFLLRFLVALGVHFNKIEAFIFSSTLIKISEYLNSKNLSTTLAVLSKKADNWSSGTKIGDCLKIFNEQHAKRILNGHSTVIILSDGLDTGEPNDLAKELKKIKLRTRQLIWLNPLKGMKGFQPIQKGMRAALPEINIFKSAHNLDSLLELENLLSNV